MAILVNGEYCFGNISDTPIPRDNQTLSMAGIEPMADAAIQFFGLDYHGATLDGAQYPLGLHISSRNV